LSTSTPAWSTAGERGSLTALRLMAWLALELGRPLTRLLLPPIALYYLCFAPQARRHSARYLGRVLGRPPRRGEIYRHFHAYAAVVLDRVYFVRGRLDVFDLSVQGGACVDATLAAGSGAFLLGAHLGSFAALHALGASRPGLRVAMAMYPDNARKIQQVLQAVAPDGPLAVIAVGRSGSMLAIRDALDAGSLVGLLGDRWVGPQTARTAQVAIPFLGRPALFADGPLRLAMLLHRRVIFMVGLYRGGRRYELRFETLADFSAPVADAAERERQVQHALRAYVDRLEQLCREAPDNWFNFYDYWGEDLAP
jgi:hypothetical protein